MDQISNHIGYTTEGLNDAQVLESRKKHGINRLEYRKESGMLAAIRNVVKEPMIILLFIASSIYFISGNTGDGVFLATAIIFVAFISLYQDSRSRIALEKLQQFTQPACKVIRNGDVIEIKSEELVIGDCLMVEEGSSVPADGKIIQANDFSVNESILTGESLPVYKEPQHEMPYVFQGTTVVSGLAIAIVSAIGNETKLGKIGKSLENIEDEKTPLENQINNFVKKMVIAGVIIFIIVWAINYINSRDLLQSLLKALTLAMSILPEEIPVAFTTFMALGSWRLMKMGIIVKQMKTVETLASATVICADKTGTITENRMTLAKLYSFQSQRIVNAEEEVLHDDELQLIRFGMFASEPIPFDPMEQALHHAYTRLFPIDERKQYKMFREYPLGGSPPMMTHVFQNISSTANHHEQIIAMKGAPEALMNLSGLNNDQVIQIHRVLEQLAQDGYRVLAVGASQPDGNTFPLLQEDFHVVFKGLIAFYDPPKKNIRSVFDNFRKAGIQVKIVTGDYSATTLAIAKQIDFDPGGKILTGDELIKLSPTQLSSISKDIHIYTRMYPEAKLKIIETLKARQEIVAMTGDGVNDGPALKAAHIGIAMGKKGSEIAREAAKLILLEDDLSKMLDAIAMGRKIYSNLKKAIQYIISIHIPIILTVFIPLALGWKYPNIFSPVHIILLELIMGPTCSIIYENEPMEENTMTQKPRKFTKTFFNWTELMTSILQGLLITLGCLSIYQYATYLNYNEDLTRTMVFTTLISSNIFLTLVNRSFYYSAFTTLKYKNKLIPLIISLTIILTAFMLYVNPVTWFFQFESLSVTTLLICITTGLFSVIWFEIVKWRKRGVRL